jgi:uncharacterized membrane protein YqaE (UPF0057 family)
MWYLLALIVPAVLVFLFSGIWWLRRQSSVA